MATRKSKSTARASVSGYLDPSLLVPADPEDCFSVEFDLTVKECQRCHDAHACSLARQYLLKQTVVKTEEEKGPFLDQTVLVPYKDLEPWLKTGNSLDELLAFAHERSVCPDPDTVTEYVMSIIAQAKLRVKGGVLCE